MQPDCQIEIGIDVGWSLRSRSCGVALRGVAPGWTAQHVNHYGDGIVTKLFTLAELVEWLPTFIDAIRDNLPRTTLIVDGPLGRNGRPCRNRHVDGACRIAGFHRRAFPNDVEGTAGQQYVDATYQIVQPFLDAGPVTPWLGKTPRGGLTVGETHPTVGLAMLLPQLDICTLPSRRRPFRVPADGNRLVNAKSDWYWMRGAGTIIAEILGSPASAAEMDHERRAALFCLAVACSLSGNEAISIGLAHARDNIDRTGAYILPANVHEDWRLDVQRVGVAHGAPSFTHETRLVDLDYEPSPTRRTNTVAIQDHDLPANVDADEMELPFGQQTLYLRDFGGIWEQHNPWLSKCDAVTKLKALDGRREEISLRRARGKGQWITVEGSTTICGLARNRDFTGSHLSVADAVGIPVEVMNCG